MQAAIKPAGAKGAGCYKCGKTGHWSRDCRAPPEERISKGAGGMPRQTAASGEPASAEPAILVAAAAKQKRQRPKVTLELLKQPSGIPDVYHNFPAVCKRQFRGPGHEVADLRRLLEMYKRWQDRIFPHTDFDGFIAEVERLSSKKALKHELNEMRANLVKLAQDAAMPPQMEAPCSEQEPAEGGGPAPASLGDEDELMLDDDELLELAAQPGYVAVDERPASLPDDDELLELAMGSEKEQGLAGAFWQNDGEEPLELPVSHVEPVQPPGYAAPEEQPLSLPDDDELFELAMGSQEQQAAAGAFWQKGGEEHLELLVSHTEPVQSSAVPSPVVGERGTATVHETDAAPAVPLNAGGMDDDDEELLALALADNGASSPLVCAGRTPAVAATFGAAAVAAGGNGRAEGRAEAGQAKTREGDGASGAEGVYGADDSGRDGDAALLEPALGD